MINTEISTPEPPVQSFEVEEYQRGISDGFQTSGASRNSAKGKGLRLFCFSCHRMESHYNTLKGKAYHYLLIGLSFGLVTIFGRYRCRCCGHRRLARYNFLNLRYHYHLWKYSGKQTAARRNGSAQSGVRASRVNGSLSIDSALSGEIGNGQSSDHHRRKKRRLKSAPIIQSIGRERRRRELEQQAEQHKSGAVDFSIEGLVTSFETEASRRFKAKLKSLDVAREPFVPKKAKPRKKIEGRPKRRYARKTKLSGPTIYCFGCKQNNVHFHRLKGTTVYFFVFGVTFGLIALLGPFRCSVCSKNRLIFSNLLNPKFHIRHLIERSGDGYN